MNETVAQYWEKTLQYWNHFNKTQKWMIVGTFLLTFLTLVLLIYNFSKTEYSLAYTDLNSTDAAAIRDYLDSAGIPYRFSNDGRAIGVPSRQVTDVKLTVESQNLIQSGSIGYGIFRDNISGFGMTDNQFDILSVDAKAGEIQQLINGISGVRQSKVLLNLQEQSVFIRNDFDNKPSASVVVHFMPGYSRDQSKIDTMYNLVAKSIANLEHDNITISDQNGDELLPSSRLNTGANSTADIVTRQFEIKKRYETDIQRNIQSFLGQILGPEKVVVSVVSTLNFDQENRQERLFTPVNEIDQQGIERSVQEIQRSYTSDSGSPAGGVPGTGTSDIPTYQGNNTTGTTSSEELERIVNYEINEISRSIESSPYVVQDLTVFAGIEPADPNDMESLSQETKDEIKSMLVNIVSASLVDSGRVFTREEIESKVSVITSSFHGRSIAETGAPATWLDYLIYGLAGAAVMALAVIGVYAIRKRRRQEEEMIDEAPGVAVKPSIPSIDFDTVINENVVKKQLESLAQKQPEEFVNLLRTWLSDE